jgi:hypothetical protein
MKSATRITRSLLTAAGFLAASLLAACGSGDNGRDPVLGMNPATLVSLAVTPATATVAAGNTQQLTATATYSDGSAFNVTALSAWTSASTPVATIGAATGLARGASAGSAVVTAVYGSKNASSTIVVLPPVIASIAVTPATSTVAIGATQQFDATATYSDNTTVQINGIAAWSSATAANGTVSATGLATGLAGGTTVISAASGGKTGTAVLTVLAAGVPPPVVVPPVVVVPQPGLNLGNAASFAVLAGTSITNNAGGTTLVTGDVGSPSQTVDPVVAAGFTDYKSGALLTNALADLQVAITDAKSRTCDVNSAAGIDLGGLVFTPGVYCYAGAISITGTFTMNGPGTYIFRTASTLNTTANSIVALNGGATADNVFWIPTGASTLGANSVFKGAILAQSAAITMGDNATLLNGRVLSAAAVTLRNNKITK